MKCCWLAIFFVVAASMGWGNDEEVSPASLVRLNIEPDPTCGDFVAERGMSTLAVALMSSGDAESQGALIGAAEQRVRRIRHVRRDFLTLSGKRGGRVELEVLTVPAKLVDNQVMKDFEEWSSQLQAGDTLTLSITAAVQELPAYRRAHFSSKFFGRLCFGTLCSLITWYGIGPDVLPGLGFPELGAWLKMNRWLGYANLAASAITGVTAFWGFMEKTDQRLKFLAQNTLASNPVLSATRRGLQAVADQVPYGRVHRGILFGWGSSDELIGAGVETAPK